ncbi:MAG: hypothetical protein V4591_10895 [Bdellovibrionota bacterium]
MNQFTLSQLRDVADNLSLLAGTFQTKPFYLRAKQIRQADKALISADALFSQKLCQEAKQWKSAWDGVAVLQKKLSLLQEKQEEIDELDKQIDSFRLATKAWFALEENERLKIIQNTKRANHFIANQNDQVEAHILHRYKRYIALKALIPFSENASYLCEAIFHHENHEKYEDNIVKLEEKIVKAKKRLKTVQRGFWMSVLFCVFIMTILICFPFAISLWKRKCEIESQITNYEETLRRENKRLVAADEGSVVAQEIRDVLGNVSLELIREVLIEVKELRSEFLGPDRTASSTALLLNFMDINKPKLVEVFGEMPEDPLESFYWLSENVNKYQNTETHILQLEEKKNRLILQQKQFTKGYSKEMLKHSIEKLKSVVSNSFHFPFEDENKYFFVDLCLDTPQVLSQIREILFYVSRNHPVDLNYWDVLKMKIQSYSNTLSLCVLDAEIFGHTEQFLQAKEKTA